MNDKYKKYKEYIQLAIFIIPLMYAIFKYTNDFIDVPDQFRELQKEVMELKEEKKEKDRRQDSLLTIHTTFLQQDFKLFINHGWVNE